MRACAFEPSLTNISVGKKMGGGADIGKMRKTVSRKYFFFPFFLNPAYQRKTPCDMWISEGELSSHQGR